MTEKTISAKGELIPLFATPLVKTNIGRDFTETELQLFFEDIPMEKDENKRKMQNHQSKDFYLFDSHGTDILKDIRNFCERQLKNYLEEIAGIDTDLAGLRITQSWLNKTKPGEYHHPHYHGNSYLSGVLYICCLPNDSINFENRSYGLYDNTEFSRKNLTVWNSNGAVVTVKEGDLIIFPSWIPHHVNVNETKNRERISLAFNTFPIGEMGNYDGATHLKL
jgi:uncharacterized protein (TIGR02466 family)